MEGQAVAKNNQQAEICFERGIKRGNASSIIHYGECLFNRETTPAEQQHVYELFLEAAELYPVGKYQLARCHLMGFGIKKDTQKALEMLTEVADSVPQAQYILAKLYNVGLEVEKNIEKAVEFLEKIMLKTESLYTDENVISNTVTDLIRIYLKGKDKVPANLKRVSELLEFALKGDLEKVNLILAVCHLKGICRPLDWKLSFDFLNKGLEDEAPSYSAYCHYLLGLYYLHGIGTEKNIIQAFKHFQNQREQ